MVPTMRVSLWRSRLAGLLIATVVLCSASACSIPCEGGDERVLLYSDIQSADGEMDRRLIKKLGISLELPDDVMNVSVEADRWLEKTYGVKLLSFVLMKLPTGTNLGDLRFLSGYVMIYPGMSKYEETLQNGNMMYGAAVGMPRLGFDTLFDYDLGEELFHWDQRVYRVDRRAPDGRALQAVIIRCEYGADETERKRELDQTERILRSVRFEPK